MGFVPHNVLLYVWIDLLYLNTCEVPSEYLSP